jgi:hypothetical protein
MSGRSWWVATRGSQLAQGDLYSFPRSAWERVNDKNGQRRRRWQKSREPGDEYRVVNEMRSVRG